MEKVQGLATLESHQLDVTMTRQLQNALSDPHPQPKAVATQMRLKKAWKRPQSDRCHLRLQSHSRSMGHDDEQVDVPASLAAEDGWGGFALSVAPSEASGVLVGGDR